MNLSKSQYTKYRSCPKRLWLYRNKKDVITPPSPELQKIFDRGHFIGELAWKCFPGGILVKDGHKNPQEAIKRTQELMAQGVPHKTKTAEQVSSYDGETPQWFKDGIEAALLAPTALAKQAFTVRGKGNKVSISCDNGIFTGVDTGLVKYHFELGAGKDNFQWE